jgi:hypothetical protein
MYTARVLQLYNKNIHPKKLLIVYCKRNKTSDHVYELSYCLIIVSFTKKLICQSFKKYKAKKVHYYIIFIEKSYVFLQDNLFYDSLTNPFYFYKNKFKT